MLAPGVPCYCCSYRPENNCNNCNSSVQNAFPREVESAGYGIMSPITPPKKYVNINGKVSKDKWQSMFRYLARYVLLLPPNHLIHDTHIALDNLHYLGADILIHIIGDGDTMLTVFAEFYGGINCL